MLTLKAEKRNPDEKAKKLRRDGFITGVLYGKEMKENVSLKFTEKDASAFIKNAKSVLYDVSLYFSSIISALWGTI